MRPRGIRLRYLKGRSQASDRSASANIQGFQYDTSVNGHAPAIVLNPRLQGALPKEAHCYRALNDDRWVEELHPIALRLSYGLRQVQRSGECPIRGWEGQ